MGLFDSVGGMLGELTGGQQNSDPKVQLVQGLVGLLSSGAGANGLPGFVSAFEQAGLGHVVQSWISSDTNLPISGEQIQQVLGNLGGDHLQTLADQAGISPAEAADHLAAALPAAVDKLTPAGMLPAGGAEEALGLIKGLFSK